MPLFPRVLFARQVTSQLQFLVRQESQTKNLSSAPRFLPRSVFLLATSEAFRGLHPAGCNLDSREAFRLVFFIRLGLRNQTRLILSQTFGHFRQRVTHEALPAVMVMSEAFRGLHPAGCNLDSHEAFRLVFFIRLGLRNQTRLILSQTFGHFRQRVTHEALPAVMVMSEVLGGLHLPGAT